MEKVRLKAGAATFASAIRSGHIASLRWRNPWSPLLDREEYGWPAGAEHVCLALPCAASAKTHAAAKPAPLTKRERAEHALDRLTFGPRPGDVERVEKMGVERWIDEQLHPEKIDDSALEARLNALPAMRLSTEELIRSYPPPPIIRQVDAGRIAMPSDPVERVIYSNALANYREQRKEKAADWQPTQVAATSNFNSSNR